MVAAPATTTTTTTTTPTVYVSSTGFSTSPAGNCATTVGCVSLLVPIGSPNNTVGTAVGLPATPNSLVFDRQGAKAYMGTDFSFFGSRGLMQITVASPPTVTQFKSVTGKVLTVSPDGKKVILSGADPNAVPVPGSNTPPPATQVIVFDTTSNTSTTLNIAGATAADFSPDNLRAFIAAGSNLYVWSAQDALKKISLTAPATGCVVFSGRGVRVRGRRIQFFFSHGLEHMRPEFRADQQRCAARGSRYSSRRFPGTQSIWPTRLRPGAPPRSPAFWRWIRPGSTSSAWPARPPAAPQPQAAVQQHPSIWARAASCPSS